MTPHTHWQVAWLKEVIGGASELCIMRVGNGFPPSGMPPVRSPIACLSHLKVKQTVWLYALSFSPSSIWSAVACPVPSCSSASSLLSFCPLWLWDWKRRKLLVGASDLMWLLMSALCCSLSSLSLPLWYLSVLYLAPATHRHTSPHGNYSLILWHIYKLGIQAYGRPSIVYYYYVYKLSCGNCITITKFCSVEIIS